MIKNLIFKIALALISSGLMVWAFLHGLKTNNHPLAYIFGALLLTHYALLIITGELTKEVQRIDAEIRSDADKLIPRRRVKK